MSQTFTVRGVPQSLARDAWWMSGPEVSPPPLPPHVPNRLHPLRGWPGRLGFVILLALGDALFWGHNAGLSLVLFAWAVFGAACLGRPAQRRPLWPAVGLGLCSLPMLEYGQALSVLFLFGGLVFAVAALRVPPGQGAGWMARAVLALIARLPIGGVIAGLEALRMLCAQGPRRKGTAVELIRQTLRNWAFPLGGALILLWLLTAANPVLDQALEGLIDIDIRLGVLGRRALFWSGLGLMIWPFLEAPDPTRALALPTRRFGFGLSAGSVLRALVVFNAMLAVQTVLDASILLGGAALPEGMSYATYAHRGAYPLLMTATLAGAFALIARPFLKDHGALQPLMLLWLGQNIVLTLTALLRLDLYVEAFGLTYLRLHAAVWMWLVAAGLGLVVWQILRAQSSAWLLSRTAALGAGTLYLCCFVNFAGLIAGSTVRAAGEGTQERVDWYYLCQLPPTTARATLRALNDYPDLERQVRRSCLMDKPSAPAWREWDFRTWRMQGYHMPPILKKAAPDEDPSG